MRQNKDLVRLGRKLRARGQAALGSGSVVANAAQGGAAPGTAGGPAGRAPGAGKPNFHPLAVLKGLETGKLLTGKDLTRGARALTALELRPQLHGYKQLANQLTRERNEETTGLGKLGSELQGNVGSVYKGIGATDAQGTAAQQAIAGMLNDQASAIAKQGSDSLAQMQGGAVGDFNKALELRGAPVGGSAQQALSDAVAQQQSAQTANAQAAQQFAASQGAGNAALSAQLAGATQMAGGAAVGGIGRDIVGRVGESNQKYDEAIQQALGKLGDVKATKGALFNKNLLGLRGEEQKFLLGKQAVQGEKASLAQQQAEAGEDAKQQQFDNQLSLAQLGLDRWKAHHPDAGSSEVKEKKEALRQERGEVKSLIAPLIAELGAPPKNPKQLQYFIAKMNSKASADPALVQKVIQGWWQKRVRTQGNRGEPGATTVPHAP